MELKNSGTCKITIIPIIIGALGIVTKGVVKGLEELEITERVEDCPNYSIAKIAQNTENSPGYLWRLAVTQTRVENH